MATVVICCVLCTSHAWYAAARARRRRRFPRRRDRRAGRRRRRGVLHDRDDGLRRGRHRPELRRAGALLRVPADRHLRRRRAADGVGARAMRGGGDARRAAGVRRVAARARRRRPHGRRHARARAADPRRRRPALRGRRGAGRGAARAGARGAADRRPSARPHRRCDGAVRARRGPARRAGRPRLEAFHPAPRRRGRPRVRGAARRRRRGRDRGAEAPRGDHRERPRRPRRPHRSGRDDSRAARPRAALRHLPGSPAARARARARDVQAPVRAPRREPSRSRRRHRPRARHRPEPRLRGRGERRHLARLAQRRHLRGARRRRLRERPVPPRGRARPARRPALLRPAGRGMPKRTDLRTILILGSGPIRIGQACEFDYSGAQACRVVLVNSNPATIMTDPEWADATYLEPLDAETVAQVIERERPDAILPTLGGQTGLNLGVELAPLGIELIGADLGAIRRAEDRELFRSTVQAAGLPVPRSVVAHEPVDFELPAIVRPAFTLGGTGGGVARTREELRAAIEHGVAASPVGQVLVEEYLEGWQEHELEVMCDAAGNAVVVCSIENLDPMGVHTGDSWTVAPQQTLDDATYQRLRDAAFTTARAVGVATGGANVQFAVHPATNELRVIEMNPRVSRSSALASKATGFPIAKLAALLAVGYTLDELPNDITKKTTAAFEPALDYVAVKAPRFDFEKFPTADRRLGAEMRAVGETLGLGRTFAEAFVKAVEGREAPPVPFDGTRLGEPLPGRWDLLLEAAHRGLDLPGIHPYFAEALREAALVTQCHMPRGRPPRVRHAVDSCAGEFEAETPYYYLAPGAVDEGPPPSGRAVVVLGSGPNRIGQGIEFDYCCVHAVQALQAVGYEAVLVNSNPETVSTDYDTSDRLYLEPLTEETVLEICALEQPVGVAVSFGGQTPLRLAPALAAAGLPLLGDPLDAIDAAEDRSRFAALAGELSPPWGAAGDAEEARTIAERIGYPVLVRPHHVLGGRGMHVAYASEELRVEGPCLVDRFLAGALELDVDALCDGESAWAAAILEHVEPAGVHSGDSACVFPGPSVTEALECQIREVATRVAHDLGARGLLNLQLAVHEDRLWVLEANPRASRTVPFTAKATGVPVVEHAVRLLVGENLADLDLPERAEPTRAWAKEAVFPSDRFEGAAARGPEMRSTGEVMASAATAPAAYARALRAAGKTRRGGRIGGPLQAA